MENKKIYIVAENYNLLNFRILKLLTLRNKYKILLFVARSKNNNKIIHPDDIFIRKYKNIFGIFRKLGFSNIANKLSSIFYFPSSNILYIKKVVSYIEKDIVNNKINDLILITTCPPHDLALVGLTLKKKYPNLKWINDLQDLWSYDEYYFNRFTEKEKKKVLALESKILNKADYTVVSNEFAQNVLINKYKVPLDKVKSIYHPFDRKELNIEIVKNVNNIPSIAFVGMLFKEPKVPGKKLILALNDYVKKRGKKIIFNLIGDIIPENLKSMLDSNLIIKEYKGLNHTKAFELASQSDYLSILLGDVANARVIMHAKLSHYLLLNKPILAFVPEDSFVAKVVNTTGTGRVINFKQIWSDEIDLIIQSENEFYKPDGNEIEKFCLENFLNEFMKVID